MCRRTFKSLLFVGLFNFLVLSLISLHLDAFHPAPVLAQEPSPQLQPLPTPQPDEDEEMEEQEFTDIGPVICPHCPGWSPNVRFITDRGSCSGTLIDPKHVLSAAHCVYSRTVGFTEQIEVIPAYDNGNKPYGSAYLQSGFVWKEYVSARPDRLSQLRAHDWDLSLIELDRPVGALAGWYGYRYNNNDDFFKDNSFFSAGYPGFDIEHMNTWSGNFDCVKQDRIIHYPNLCAMKREKFHRVQKLNFTNCKLIKA